MVGSWAASHPAKSACSLVFGIVFGGVRAADQCRQPPGAVLQPEVIRSDYSPDPAIAGSKRTVVERDVPLT